MAKKKHKKQQHKGSGEFIEVKVNHGVGEDYLQYGSQYNTVNDCPIIPGETEFVERVRFSKVSKDTRNMLKEYMEDAVERYWNEKRQIPITGDLKALRKDTLFYDGVMDEWIYDYGDYLDLNDETFVEIGEDELGGWERDHVVGLRETLDLKSSIDKPESYVSFKWMEEFTEDHAGNYKFLNDAEKALRNRHPFRGFRSALDMNGLADEWYAYRDSRMEDYLKSEMV